MGASKTTDQEARDAALAIREFGSLRKAAEAVGVAATTLWDRAQKYDDGNPTITVPDIPSAEMETPELVGHLARRYDKQRAKADAQKWMKFRVHGDGPFAFLIWGDPHLGDLGCNIGQLSRDRDLLIKTPGLWGIGLGDYCNFWGGRLQRAYSEQETSRDQEWQLCEWFFDTPKDGGGHAMKLLIKGNHDMMSEAAGYTSPMEWLARGAAPLEDWKADIEVVCPNGRKVKMSFAHDFKGTSIYNPAHAPMRKGLFTGGEAALYACGHRHNWAIYEREHEDTGNIFWAVRARGYKDIDGYADRHGFGSQEYGASIVAVVDPDATGPQAIRCFPHVEEGVDFLKYKRASK